MSTDPEPRADSSIGPVADDLAERSRLVLGYEILRSDPEPVWDSLVRVAAALVDMPIALVSWFDGARLWFKARVGFPFDCMPLSGSLCERTLLTNDTTVVGDLARDPFYLRSYAVTELGARAYVGVPIHAPGRNVAIGTLCVVDRVERDISPDKIAALEGLGRQAEALLELRLEKRRIEKARRAQVAERKRLEATLDAAAVGVFVSQIPDRPDYGNPALERILGRQANDLALGWHQIVHPDDLSIPARWEEHATARPPRPMDYRIRIPDGSTRWVRNHMAPIREGESIAGWVGTIADITELKALEARLRATEERLEFAIAVGEHGVWDWDLVTNHCVYSDSWFKLFDVDKHAAAQHVDTWRALVHPDDRPTLAALQQAHFRGETPLYQVEYRFRRAHEWRWIFARGKIVARAPDGRPLRFVGTNMDVTTRRLAEDEVRLAHERLLDAESIAGLGHWTFDPQRQRLSWSPNMYVIFQRAPERGPPSREESVLTMVPDDREPMEAVVAAAVQAGLPWSVEYRIRAHDGEIRYLHSRGRKRVEADGIYFDGTEQDITDVVRVREALRDAKNVAEVASRAKADFLATMSHEIRTPLNGVLGMAELLRGTELTPEQKAFVDVARASGDWLLALVSDVLDFSKIDAAKMELRPQPFDLRALVDDVAGVVAESAQRKGLELWVDIARDVPARLVGDTQRIRQIVLNLAANAVKFTERGEVELVAGALVEDGLAHVHISVRDTGPGIPEHLQTTVFEAFVQDPHVSRRQGGGTGLGLPIAQRLAQLMGGLVSVTSEPGHGSTFTLQVPLPIVAMDLRPPTIGRPVSVVVANAHAGAAASLERALRNAGAEVRVVYDEHGLARAEGYDILLLDQNVGDRCHAIARDVRARHGASVIFATVVAERASVPPGLFSSLLVKPVRQSTLVDVIRQIAAPHARAPSAPRERIAAGKFDGTRVLIAEDNRINSFLLRALLERFGCAVDIVEDGAGAIVAVRERRYDVVFMDCIMADMDGYAATAAIRAAEEDVHVPIVAVTASAIEGDRERCLAAGMDDYLTKPITNEAIASALERWVG